MIFSADGIANVPMGSRFCKFFAAAWMQLDLRLRGYGGVREEMEPIVWGFCPP